MAQITHKRFPQARYLAKAVREDLARKMVFVGGPRQVGKTTFALTFLGKKASEKHPAYLNWDNPEHREKILRAQFPSQEKLVILDEIHKFAGWRNLVKGYYDTHKSETTVLVIGSARLDYYRKGGDSLQGRYHYYRLHPFSLSEVDAACPLSALEGLLQFGGFPEPLRMASERQWRRWQREQRERVIRDDLRDLERVREISMLELLLEHLPRCVGSPLSVLHLSQLLQVSPHAVEHWISILERLYVCFRIAPFGSAKIRAVRKEKKLYFWDWSQAPEGGARFENLVASQLLKYCHFQEDTQGYRMELRFLRDTDKREIDFVVLQEGQPAFAVECKSGDQSATAAAGYFRERTAIPLFYQVHLQDRDFGSEKAGVRVLPFARFCKELKMP